MPAARYQPEAESGGCSSGVAAWRDLIRQILLNLIRNAAEALGPGGAITVSIQDGINLNGRQYVEMAVADNGQSLPDHVRAKLFQPTVNFAGGGHAGLGLAIVKSLAEVEWASPLSPGTAAVAHIHSVAANKLTCDCKWCYLARSPRILSVWRALHNPIHRFRRDTDILFWCNLILSVCTIVDRAPVIVCCEED
ncbi:MAG: ATP-binding protein [Candidatus Competibacteraceae bacterium]